MGIQIEPLDLERRNRQEGPAQTMKFGTEERGRLSPSVLLMPTKDDSSPPPSSKSSAHLCGS